MASINSEEYQLVISALNRSQSFIANIENGERWLDIVKLLYIVRLLSLDLA